MFGACARLPAWLNPPSIRDIIAQPASILVVDFIHLLGAESAYFTPREISFLFSSSLRPLGVSHIFLLKDNRCEMLALSKLSFQGLFIYLVSKAGQGRLDYLEGQVVRFHIFFQNLFLLYGFPLFDSLLGEGSNWLPVKEEHPIGDDFKLQASLSILPFPGASL